MPYRTDLMPLLLCTNRQIHKEAIGAFYNHVFEFADTEALTNFLTMVGRANRQQLRTIQLYSWSSVNGPTPCLRNQMAMIALADARRLEAFCFKGRLHWWDMLPEKLAQLFYLQAHFFLDALDRARGNHFAALDIVRFSGKDFDIPRTEGRPNLPNGFPNSSYEYETRFYAELRKLMGC